MVAIKFVVFFVAVTFVSGKFVHEMKMPGKDIPFTWLNCSTNELKIVVEELKLSPEPIKLGKNIILSAIVRVKEPVGLDERSPVNVDLTADVVKPGQEQPLDVCEYDEGHCHFKNVCSRFKGKESPKIQKELGLPYKCPLLTGIYRIPKTTFRIPELEYTINGVFNVTIKITEGKTQIGCLTFKFCLESCY
ncbi:GM2 ganglioside activator [Mactra antiquata]